MNNWNNHNSNFPNNFNQNPQGISQQQAGDLNNSNNNYQIPPNMVNEVRCNVPGCTEGHATHYCRNCRKQDSNHLTRNCPNKSANYQYNRYTNNPTNNHQILPNTINEVRCNVIGCTEGHAAHYCSNCRKQNSDHFASNCPNKSVNHQHNGYTNNPNNNSQIPPNMNNRLHCNVPDCSEQHATHYCKNCGKQNSDHFASNCPNQSVNYQHNGYTNNPNNNSQIRPKMNNRLHCNVPDCSEQHATHYCKNCGKQNSDHFASNCPNQSVNYRHNGYTNTPNNNYNGRIECKANGCNKKHSRQYCRFCEESDANHVAMNCHTTVVLYHATSIDFLFSKGSIAKFGLQPRDPKKSNRFGKGLF